jgi:ATP-binding protein involved in chromosome partitioning
MNTNSGILKDNILNIIRECNCHSPSDDTTLKNLNLLIKKNSIFIHIEITDKKIIDSSNIIYNRVIECLNLIDEYKGLDLKISYSIVDSGEENIDIGSQTLRSRSSEDDTIKKQDVNNINNKKTCSSNSPKTNEEKMQHSKNIKQKKEKASIKNIKHIIIIASGKGGVGKSTISANLAITMSKIGWRVGLLDADIYGASIPTIFDLQNNQIDLDDDTMMIPFEKHGIKINSIEFITKPHEALIWRGPMLAKILDQLLKNTAWGDLDFLIIDTPPGTGDIHITLLESYNIDGYLLVSTPHQTSINNSKKTQNMFEKFNVKNLSLIINMAWLNDDSNRKQNIFCSGDLSILNCENIIQIPMIPNHNNNLFALEPHYEKSFIDMCRNVVTSIEL